YYCARIDGYYRWYFD
nr:immunoglobulin heavy chain junction region [Mus musculus]